MWVNDNRIVIAISIYSSACKMGFPINTVLSDEEIPNDTVRVGSSASVVFDSVCLCLYPVHQRILISCLIGDVNKVTIFYRLLHSLSIRLLFSNVIWGLTLGLNAPIFYYHHITKKMRLCRNGKPCGLDITNGHWLVVYRHELCAASDCSASCDWNKIRMKQYWLFVIRGGH